MSSVSVPASVNITAKDPNGGDIAKQFNSVKLLSFDYARRTVHVSDQTGSFYFDLNDIATLTYTINGTQTTVVMS